jgi:hypothetical protein
MFTSYNFNLSLERIPIYTYGDNFNCEPNVFKHLDQILGVGLFNHHLMTLMMIEMAYKHPCRSKMVGLKMTVFIQDYGVGVDSEIAKSLFQEILDQT